MTQKVIKKATFQKHLIKKEELKDLPYSIKEPILVYKSMTLDNYSLLLEEETAEGKMTVILEINKDRDGVTVNDIRSIHDKDKENLVNHITKLSKEGTVFFANKQKIFEVIDNSVSVKSEQHQYLKDFYTKIKLDETNVNENISDDPNIYVHDNNLVSVLNSSILSNMFLIMNVKYLNPPRKVLIALLP